MESDDGTATASPPRPRRVPSTIQGTCAVRATKYLEERKRVRHMKAESRAVKYGYHQRPLIPIDMPAPPPPLLPADDDRSVRLRKAQEEGIYTSSLETNFVNAIKTTPPLAPTSLVKFNRKRRGIGKVRVLLRIAKNNTECARFLDVNERRKQITVSDPAAPIMSQLRRKHIRSVAPKTFAFDTIITSEMTQAEICDSSLVEVIHSVLSGTDGCITCYGQARLGKSSLMVGRDDCAGMLGLVPTSISWLFKLIEHERQKTKCHFAVSVSALEVNSLIDQVQDLLLDHRVGPWPDPTPWSKEGGTNLGLQNLNQTLLNVISPEGAAYYLDCALQAWRQIKGIDTSDEKRKLLAKFSHFCFTVHVQQKVRESNGRAVVLSSRLYLIDLASCEKPPGLSSQMIPKLHDGATVTSLSSLGNILMAVVNGEKRLTHKESKLTQLLQESLGNPSCRTNIIVHVSSLPQHYQDTLTVVQVTSRIHKMRKRRNRFSGTSSSGGESSSEDSYRRRYRWRPLGRRHGNSSSEEMELRSPPSSVASPDESEYWRMQPLLSDIPDFWTSDSEKESDPPPLPPLPEKMTSAGEDTGDTAIYVGDVCDGTDGEGPPLPPTDFRAEVYVQDGPSAELQRRSEKEKDDDVFLSPRHERELTAYIEKLLKQSPIVPPPFPSLRSQTTSLRLPTSAATQNSPSRPRTISDRGDKGSGVTPVATATHLHASLHASSSDFLSAGHGTRQLTSLLGRLLALDGGGFAPISLSPADSSMLIDVDGKPRMLSLSRGHSFKYSSSEVGTATSAGLLPKLLSAAAKKCAKLVPPPLAVSNANYTLYSFDNLSPETLDEKYGENGSPMRALPKPRDPPPLPLPPAVKKLHRPRSLVHQRSEPAGLGSRQRASVSMAIHGKSRASSVCESTADSDHTCRSSTHLLKKKTRREKVKRGEGCSVDEEHARVECSAATTSGTESRNEIVPAVKGGVKKKKKKKSWPARWLRKLFPRKSSKTSSSPTNDTEDSFAESLAVREARMHPLALQQQTSKNTLTLV